MNKYLVLISSLFLFSCSSSLRKPDKLQPENRIENISISESINTSDHDFEEAPISQKQQLHFPEISELKLEKSSTVTVERPKPEPQKFFKEEEQIIKKQPEQLKSIQEKKMELLLSSTLGTIFYSIVIFVAGALIGAPLWSWVSKKLPWNK